MTTERSLQDHQLMEDALNWIEQAQSLVVNSPHHGASVLASMGSRLIERLQEELPYD